MVGQRIRRLRTVALTGAVMPGLVLGAIGVGILPGALLPTGVAAQSVIEGGTCTAFGASEAAQGTEMSVADVAESTNPAIVTILNLQPLSEVDLDGFPGIDGIPGLPEIPGIDELPGIEGIEGSEDLPGSDEAPNADGDGGDEDQQSDDADNDDQESDESDDADDDDEQSDEADNDDQQSDDADDDTLVPAGTGSGFIVDELGHVVTNAHVVAGAEELTVALADGTEVPATVVGSDDILDVAVLELDLPAGVAVPGVAAFGDSSTLRAGDQVIAIGNALGSFPNTVSEGTVNGTDRSFPSEGGLTTWIQHDAEIWQGSSGGPLLNLQGEVVGINTAGIGSGMVGVDPGSADLAFAVEGNTVCRAAAELLANGEIVWPYLGIQGEASADGQTVVEVVEDGPSDEAGIEVGDVITAFDGQEITRQNSLLDLLFEREPGDVVTVTVDRDGETASFEVTLGERPEITE
ncbi:MAG: 2-alkenal reductase [Thermomicrobiales bacterium]|jgi:S1-C subfamily serine protease|nr:2-alkenal reductase [Thermomicrobiales bacterium]